MTGAGRGREPGNSYRHSPRRLIMTSHAAKCVSVRATRVLLAVLFSAALLAFNSSPRAALSDVAVAAGTVTNASGTTMTGQTVDLYAWPSDATLQALKPGQFVPTT